MRTRTIITILLSLSFTFTHAQNDKVKRDAFTLKLAVDGVKYYEQNIESTPYFVRDNVLQIYPGEKLYIEAETNKKEITSMKVVKEIKDTDKTIVLELTQIVKNGKSEMTELKIENPFKKDLEYRAMMYIVGHNEWISTNVIPIKAKLTTYETWSDVVISLVLSGWKLK